MAKPLHTLGSGPRACFCATCINGNASARRDRGTGFWSSRQGSQSGNVLGSAVNWGLGRGIERFRDEPWFPLRPARLNRATNWYRRYGRWSLLLSWMPIVGDPLTVVAGVLREPLWSFVAIVTVAKVSRYLVVAAAVLGLM
ncbi:MAG: DedA family protein [Mesorhizobium sp.]|nr:MAG: DedA family protein [Mesorhizobium sp.]